MARRCPKGTCSNGRCERGHGRTTRRTRTKCIGWRASDGTGTIGRTPLSGYVVTNDHTHYDHTHACVSDVCHTKALDGDSIANDKLGT